MGESRARFPAKGLSKEEVLTALDAAREHDVRWREGKALSLVYDAGEEVSEILQLASLLYFSENGLNPTAFPSLSKFEAEVVSMAAEILGGDEEVVGNMTSGGTESCLMAVKTARDWARLHRPEIQTPEMILPLTAHPAFDKAGDYFTVEPVHVPLGEGFQADTEAVKKAVTPNTVLIVGSAPSYPHGILDPIVELAAIAREHGILFHVDACVGGFMLPFIRRLGYPVPDFDFQVPGVTSISADLHKYGYAAKGASVILYRDRTIRRHQLFAYTDWPGGVYASPAMAGTRPAGPLAAAWAVMKYLGEGGYLAIAETVMKTTHRLTEGIAAIDGVEVIGEPVMSVFAIASDELDVYQVGDEMGLRGWHLDRQHLPPSLHLTVNYAHAGTADLFLQDLAESVNRARGFNAHRLKGALLLNLAQAGAKLLPEKLVSRLTRRASSLVGVKGASLPERSAAIYGMMGTLPNRGDLKELVLDLLEGFTQPQD